MLISYAITNTTGCKECKSETTHQPTSSVDPPPTERALATSTAGSRQLLVLLVVIELIGVVVTAVDNVVNVVVHVVVVVFNRVLVELVQVRAGQRSPD